MTGSFFGLATVFAVWAILWPYSFGWHSRDIVDKMAKGWRKEPK